MKSLPNTFTEKKPNSFPALPVSVGLFLLAAALSLSLGSTFFSPAQLWKAASGAGDPAVLRIFLHVRLPRTCACILAGSALSISGVIIQSVLGNPLAGPNIIGVNAGAGFFAVLCTALLPAWPGAVPTAAFLGALAAILLVYGIARATRASRITLVLSGVAVSSILSAGIDAVVTLIPDTLTGAASFRIGGVSGVAMQSLAVPGAYILIGAVLAFSLRYEMDILSLGDDMAKSLGLRVGGYRFCLLLTAAILAGAAVSFAGLLGFVGLIVPHGARFFTGSESRRLLPVAALVGAAFVCVCDVLARMLFAPFELPVGIVMSFLGGPFFLYLLIRRKGGRSDNG
ncbi:MAG: iron ABC transporter permease [Oscillospiraceae bacterium]|nr:iron ABC transporter permease [Oscillospiraceae bacterium]